MRFRLGLTGSPEASNETPEILVYKSGLPRFTKSRIVSVSFLEEPLTKAPISGSHTGSEPV